MADKRSLLTSKQVAAFVANGFLRFDALVPPEIAAQPAVALSWKPAE